MMLELVQRYYATERHTAFLGTAIGVTLLLAAFLLWRGTAATSLFRGTAYALVVSGLLLTSSSLGYAVMTGKRAPVAVATYAGQSNDQIRVEEVRRMEKVLGSGYAGGLAVFTAMLLIGLVLIFTTADASPWKGVALALLITGAAGHCLEANSRSVNRQYLQAIQAAG
jgi:fructose-1,6-bisphosphatase/inositol monophosphatase family enzyme